MDGEATVMLQRAADIITDEVGSISPEAIAAFLFIISREQITISQLATAMAMDPGHASRVIIELSYHSGGAGLVDVDLDGDIHRVISVNEKSIQFAQRLGYVLRG